jgi:phospholipase C
MNLHTRITTKLLATGMSGILLIPSFAQTQTPPQTTTPIQHVVVIFQENVSFDHYFATYPLAANTNSAEPSFTASPSTPGVNGLTGPLLTANPNSAPPFRLTRGRPSPAIRTTTMPMSRRPSTMAS